MREIKFRAWDKEKKEIEYDVEQGCCQLSGFCHDDWDNSEYVVMQYTGLKDKNGKEIYEGDIGRKECWKLKKDNPPGTICDFRKRFDKNGPWEKFYEYKLIEEREFFTDSEYGEDPEKWEIVGNIYENPELLK